MSVLTGEFRNETIRIESHARWSGAKFDRCDIRFRSDVVDAEMSDSHFNNCRFFLDDEEVDIMTLLRELSRGSPLIEFNMGGARLRHPFG